jgi:hypothetical protein
MKRRNIARIDTLFNCFIISISGILLFFCIIMFYCSINNDIFVESKTDAGKSIDSYFSNHYGNNWETSKVNVMTLPFNEREFEIRKAEIKKLDKSKK